jgi:hypothetical protein
MGDYEIFIECRVCLLQEEIYLSNSETEFFQNGSCLGQRLEAVCDECKNKGK